MRGGWVQAAFDRAAWVAVLGLLAEDHAGGAGLVGNARPEATGEGETEGG